MLFRFWFYCLLYGPAFRRRIPCSFSRAALLLSSSAQLSFVSGLFFCSRCLCPMSFCRAAFLFSVLVPVSLVPAVLLFSQTVPPYALFAGPLFRFRCRFPCPFSWAALLLSVAVSYVRRFFLDQYSFLVRCHAFLYCHRHLHRAIMRPNRMPESCRSIPGKSRPDKSIKKSLHSKRNHKLFFRNYSNSLRPASRPSRIFFKDSHCSSTKSDAYLTSSECFDECPPVRYNFGCLVNYGLVVIQAACYLACVDVNSCRYLQ